MNQVGNKYKIEDPHMQTYPRSWQGYLCIFYIYIYGMDITQLAHSHSDHSFTARSFPCETDSLHLLLFFIKKKKKKKKKKNLFPCSFPYEADSLRL
jgi:hypothetical protein